MSLVGDSLNILVEKINVNHFVNIHTLPLTKLVSIAINYLIPAVASQSNTQDLPEYANLKQDYYGILCYVLLKKEITTSIEQFIERVD